MHGSDDCNDATLDHDSQYERDKNLIVADRRQYGEIPLAIQIKKSN